MIAPLFYRPNPKWQIWSALCGAVLIHVAAVALAERSARPPLPTVEEPPDVFVIPFIDADPPEVIDPPPDLPLPPPPTTQTEYIEDTPTPPPVRERADRSPQRLVRTAPPATRLPMSAAKVFAVSAPRPEYPYEARRARATGSGMALLTIDPATGSVTDVRMVRSTGNAVLDAATISGLRRWRFRPGTVSVVQTPITYTLTGAAF